MGLFKDVGRKVERFKQAAQDVAEAQATHHCVDCGERYYTDQDSCTECGGRVEALETGSDGEDGPGEDAGTPGDAVDDESGGDAETADSDGDAEAAGDAEPEGRAESGGADADDGDAAADE